MTKEFKELLFRHYFFDNCNTLLKEFNLSNPTQYLLLINNLFTNKIYM